MTGHDDSAVRISTAFFLEAGPSDRDENPKTFCKAGWIYSRIAGTK